MWAAAVLAAAMALAVLTSDAQGSGAPPGNATAAKAKCKKGKKAVAAKKKGCKKKAAQGPTPPAATTPTVPPPDPPPADTDADGVPDSTDNCVAQANAGQEDDDNDGKGNACDQCPNDSNPGSAGCHATIYQVKQGIVFVGQYVRIDTVLVTAVSPDGDTIWVQHKPSDAAYNFILGPEYGGVEVDISGVPPSGVQVGNRVSVDGTVTSSDGSIDMDAAELTITNANAEAQQASSYSAADFGGTLFLGRLDGQLVKVATLTLTSQAGGVWTVSNGADSFSVGPRIIGTLPDCVDGSTFTEITGIADLIAPGTELRLLPTKAADIPMDGCSPSP